MQALVLLVLVPVTQESLQGGSVAFKSGACPALCPPELGLL